MGYHNKDPVLLLSILEQLHRKWLLRWIKKKNFYGTLDNLVKKFRSVIVNQFSLRQKTMAKQLHRKWLRGGNWMSNLFHSFSSPFLLIIHGRLQIWSEHLILTVITLGEPNEWFDFTPDQSIFVKKIRKYLSRHIKHNNLALY